MRSICAKIFSANLAFLAGIAVQSAHAQSACDRLVGKRITLRGTVTSSSPITMPGTSAGFDALIVQSVEPACGKIQTTSNLGTCRAGARYVATGRLTKGPANRPANDKPDATDYGFIPVSETGLCR